MSNAVFKLEDAGFSRPQVEALTEFMDGSVATKADIERLEGKIIGLDGTIKSEIIRLEGRMNLLQWMTGAAIAVGLSNLYMIIRISQSIG